jgi:hypothetical protein
MYMGGRGKMDQQWDKDRIDSDIDMGFSTVPLSEAFLIEFDCEIRGSIE